MSNSGSVACVGGLWVLTDKWEREDGKTVNEEKIDARFFLSEPDTGGGLGRCAVLCGDGGLWVSPWDVGNARNNRRLHARFCDLRSQKVLYTPSLEESRRNLEVGQGSVNRLGVKSRGYSP